MSEIYFTENGAICCKSRLTFALCEITSDGYTAVKKQIRLPFYQVTSAAGDFELKWFLHMANKCHYLSNNIEYFSSWYKFPRFQFSRKLQRKQKAFSEINAAFMM